MPWEVALIFKENFLTVEIDSGKCDPSLDPFWRHENHKICPLNPFIGHKRFAIFQNVEARYWPISWDFRRLYFFWFWNYGNLHLNFFFALLVLFLLFAGLSCCVFLLYFWWMLFLPFWLRLSSRIWGWVGRRNGWPEEAVTTQNEKSWDQRWQGWLHQDLHSTLPYRGELLPAASCTVETQKSLQCSSFFGHDCFKLKKYLLVVNLSSKRGLTRQSPMLSRSHLQSLKISVASCLSCASFNCSRKKTYFLEHSSFFLVRFTFLVFRIERSRREQIIRLNYPSTKIWWTSAYTRAKMILSRKYILWDNIYAQRCFSKARRVATINYISALSPPGICSHLF